MKVICFPITSIYEYKNDINKRNQIQESILTMAMFGGYDITIVMIKERSELTKEELKVIPDGLGEDYLFAVITEETK